MGWMGAAVIKPEASRLVYVRMRMGRLSAIGHSRCAAVVEPGGHMKQVIGRVLQRQVVPGDGDEVDVVRICDCGMVHVWLEQESGVVAVTAQRLSERAAHGRLRRAVFAGCGDGRVADARAATAAVRNMPGRRYGVVLRQVDRVSVRSAGGPSELYIDRMRTIELWCGSRIDLERPRS